MTPGNINLSVQEEISEVWLARATSMKFVVADDKDDMESRNLILGIDGESFAVSHTKLVPKGKRFIGAGRIENRESVRAYWGSTSCDERYGYFRPTDAAEARELLEKIADVVKNWIQGVLNK